jgi:5-methylcytosine-specific restriction endonuclease McrA
MDTAMVIGNDYMPLGETTLSRALALVRNGRAEVILDHGVYRSMILIFRLPKIIRMLLPISFSGHKVSLSSKNVFLRDKHTCQYCGVVGGRLTIDHVIPKSRGGKDTWENWVTCCFADNQRKNNRTPAEANMRLRRQPQEASLRQILMVTVRGREWFEMMQNGTFSIGEEISAA